MQYQYHVAILKGRCFRSLFWFNKTTVSYCKFCQSDDPDCTYTCLFSLNYFAADHRLTDRGANIFTLWSISVLFRISLKMLQYHWENRSGLLAWGVWDSGERFSWPHDIEHLLCIFFSNVIDAYEQSTILPFRQLDCQRYTHSTPKSNWMGEHLWNEELRQRRLQTTAKFIIVSYWKTNDFMLYICCAASSVGSVSAHREDKAVCWG